MDISNHSDRGVASRVLYKMSRSCAEILLLLFSFSTSLILRRVCEFDHSSFYKNFISPMQFFFFNIAIIIFEYLGKIGEKRLNSSAQNLYEINCQKNKNKI